MDTRESRAGVMPMDMRAVSIARDCELAAEWEPAERAELLTEAAGYWHLVGDHRRARELYERVLAEYGPEADVTKVCYAGFLAETGDRERALELLDEVWRATPAPLVHESAGEVFECVLDDPAAALRWYNRGIALAVDPADPPDTAALAGDLMLLGLFTARRRVRAALGEPADDWDRMADDTRATLPAGTVEPSAFRGRAGSSRSSPPVAARAERGLLVRLGPQVQEVLWSARLRELTSSPLLVGTIRAAGIRTRSPGVSPTWRPGGPGPRGGAAAARSSGAACAAAARRAAYGSPRLPRPPRVRTARGSSPRPTGRR